VRVVASASRVAAAWGLLRVEVTPDVW